jgi:hypothetical protein
MCGQILLEGLYIRTGSQPVAAQNADDFGDIFLADIVQTIGKIFIAYRIPAIYGQGRVA